MEKSEYLIETPWDSLVLGVPAYEVSSPDEQSLALAASLPGHFTVKIDPLHSKELLHVYGFYYCDTLLEPFCTAEGFSALPHESVTVSTDVSIDELLSICDGAFSHGRFHRDFRVPRNQADLRYNNWLTNLHAEGGIFALEYEGSLAAFFGFRGSKVVLHAVSEAFRGRGLAKTLWSAGYERLFEQGVREVSSSVSASNLPVINLYASLGFRFRNPVDVYHRFNRSGDL